MFINEKRRSGLNPFVQLRWDVCVSFTCRRSSFCISYSFISRSLKCWQMYASSHYSRPFVLYVLWFLMPKYNERTIVASSSVLGVTALYCKIPSSVCGFWSCNNAVTFGLIMWEGFVLCVTVSWMGWTERVRCIALLNLFSDASPRGLGVHLGSHWVSGSWAQDERFHLGAQRWMWSYCARTPV